MKKTLGLIFLLVFTFIFSSSAKIKKKDKLNLPQVFVQELVKKKIFNQVSYFGKIVPLQQAKIYSPIDGVVTSIVASPGIPIRKKQILATIKQNIIGLEVLPVKIKSPITGNLFRSDISENAFVRKNQHLFTVYNPDKYKLEINVSPKDGDFMKIGDPLSVKIYKQLLSGSIVSISPDIDLRTGTRLVEVFIKNDKNIQLRPGMMAEASFQFNYRQGFLVDKKHVHKKGKKTFIRLLNTNNEVQEVEVSILDRIKKSLEISNKILKTSQKIIIKSSLEPLLNKQKVQVIDKEKL